MNTIPSVFSGQGTIADLLVLVLTAVLAYIARAKHTEAATQRETAEALVEGIDEFRATLQGKPAERFLDQRLKQHLRSRQREAGPKVVANVEQLLQDHTDPMTLELTTERIPGTAEVRENPTPSRPLSELVLLAHRDDLRQADFTPGEWADLHDIRTALQARELAVKAPTTAA